MERSTLIKIHIAASIIAVITIGSFFSFSLIAEIMGSDLFIKQVKTGILYGLPILIIAMPMLALSGKKLARNSKNLILAKKTKRMKLIAINGIILISLAVYLYYHATYRSIDIRFLIVQIAELSIGFINLLLITMNIRAGIKLSGRKRKVLSS